jgi:hypothetical protein
MSTEESLSRNFQVPVPSTEPNHDSSVTGSSVAQSHRRQAINSYKALAKLKPPAGQEFSVVAYFLADNPKDVYGFYIPLGNFATKEKAKELVDHIIETTGHRSVYVMKTCSWQELDTQFRPDRTECVPVDQEGKLRRQNNKEQEEERIKLEKRQALEEDIIREKDAETDPTTIEHYTHNWFVAIKNHAAYRHYREQTDRAKASYDKRVRAIREQYTRQPEYDTQWLDRLKTRLQRSGETRIFDAIVKAVGELRRDILTSSEAESQPSSTPQSQLDTPQLDTPQPTTSQPTLTNSRGHTEMLPELTKSLMASTTTDGSPSTSQPLVIQDSTSGEPSIPLPAPSELPQSLPSPAHPTVTESTTPPTDSAHPADPTNPADSADLTENHFDEGSITQSEEPGMINPPADLVTSSDQSSDTVNTTRLTEVEPVNPTNESTAPVEQAVVETQPVTESTTSGITGVSTEVDGSPEPIPSAESNPVIKPVSPRQPKTEMPEESVDEASDKSTHDAPDVIAQVSLDENPHETTQEQYDDNIEALPTQPSLMTSESSQTKSSEIPPKIKESKNKRRKKKRHAAN